MQSRTQKNRYFALFIFGIALVLILLCLNLALGSVEFSLKEIWNSLLHPELVEKYRRSIILKIRLPRLLAAALGGAALAVSGLLLQVFFSNPIVEPYILGVSSGANLVLALMILGGVRFFGIKYISSWGLVGGAFVGAMLVLLLVILASRRVKSIVTLLIIGMMVGYVCSAITSVLRILAPYEAQAVFTMITMGTFSGFTWDQVQVLYIICIPFLLLSFALAKPLNMMLLGDNYAKSLGLSLRKFRVLMILFSGVLTATVTAFAGAISFIGLAVPHIVRMTYQSSDNRICLPASCIYGAAMGLACDLAARLLLPPHELPLGAITSLIGAPLVVYLLLKESQDL